jgi:hypothetical protein
VGAAVNNYQILSDSEGDVVSSSSADSGSDGESDGDGCADGGSGGGGGGGGGATAATVPRARWVVHAQGLSALEANRTGIQLA